MSCGAPPPWSSCFLQVGFGPSLVFISCASRRRKCHLSCALSREELLWPALGRPILTLWPATTWHNCFRFLGMDPPKLFSSSEQHHFPRTDRSRPTRAVDLPRRRRAAAAAAAADPAR